MLQRIYISILGLLLSVLLVGLTPPENSVTIPRKKLDKAVKKIWKTENFEIFSDEANNEKNCFENGCWLKVRQEEEIIGMIYVGRVNSCRSGGCSIDMDEESLAFEFFDYFLHSPSCFGSDIRFAVDDPRYGLV